MSELSKTQIEAKLAHYQDPYLKQDLMTAKAVQSIEINESKVGVKIVLGYPLAGFKEDYIATLKTVLAPIAGSRQIEIELQSQIVSHVGQRGIKGLPNVKNIIAVASGKGGVGKSTTAVNLAIALSKEGARVGILDADIYGPSQPMMLGAMETPELKDKKTLLPIVRHGIQSMSIGYLIGETAPMVWRGPMVSTALQQLLNDTLWDDLDYLIIDLPPGTGDIQLTLAQKIPVSGAVIVTTPQDLALLDARRAYEMFRKVSVPVLGIIENMSTHICSACGHEEAIFGEGGGLRMAGQYGIDLLGALPLDMQIRAQTDSGTPTVAFDPESKNAKIYREVARQVAAKLSLQAKDYSHKFPNIVIKND
ncbi:MAG: iron-sulfur cluster carrier protein ApbC [Gammaproteobacteria bacterium]|nr:iron-sulfur cluster carrier protein ApbC [Gammaproteobacteria bacterium]